MNTFVLIEKVRWFQSNESLSVISARRAGRGVCVCGGRGGWGGGGVMDGGGGGGGGGGKGEARESLTRRSNFKDHTNDVELR